MAVNTVITGTYQSKPVGQQNTQRAPTIDGDDRRHQPDAPQSGAFGLERITSAHVVAGGLFHFAEPRNGSRAPLSADDQVSPWCSDPDDLRILEFVRPAGRSWQRGCGQ